MKLALTKPSRIVAAVLGVSVAIALMPATAQASTTTKPSPGGTQVLVTNGDGWSLYADAASVASTKVSQVQVTGSIAPMTVVNCGYVTCSVYLSRAQTQSANYDINLYGGGIGGLAAACGLIALMTGPAAVVVGAACAAEIAVLGGFLLNAITHAAADNGCLRIRYGALPTAFYDDHSNLCYNT